MMLKNVFLLSNNALLFAWCCAELGPSFRIQRINKETYKKLIDETDQAVCVLIDYLVKGEIEVFAIYNYFMEEYHLPVVILFNTPHKNYRETRARFSKALFVNLYAPSETLLAVVNSFIESPSSVKYDVTRKAHSCSSKNIQCKQSFVESYDIFSGNSAVMFRFREEVQRAASCDETVLLLGESGSGKSYTAKYIHEHSTRSTFECKPLNVANLTPSVAESELFGTEAGAYTGAVSANGFFSTAEGGTLFLDEIGELSPALQAKLLDVIENRSYHRVGSMHQTPFDSRLIFATNVDLKKHVAKKLFRKDLYYRINVLFIKVPSLREHKEDIPFLAAQFVRKTKKIISSEAMEKICAYNWPGNIRELQNVLRRACAFCETFEILPADIIFE